MVLAAGRGGAAGEGRRGGTGNVSGRDKGGIFIKRLYRGPMIGAYRKIKHIGDGGILVSIDIIVAEGGGV